MGKELEKIRKNRYLFMYNWWRRKWQPTPVELDMTKWLKQQQQHMYN